MTRLDWQRDGADWPNRAHSRFVAAAGLDWHVQEAGDGPLLLLIHGTGAATHSWRGLWPLLAPHFRLLAIDLPGHGFTAAPDDLSLPGMAGGLAALLAVLEAEPVAIVGHSAGAAVAARLVLDDAAAPRLLVGIGAALEPFPGAAAFLFPAMARALFLNPVAPQLFALTAGLPGEVQRFLERSTGSAVDADGARFYGRLFRSRGHVAATLGMMAAWDLVPLARDLPALAAATLLLHGARDRAVPPDSSPEVAARLPRGRAVPLAGLGHLAHEEAPERIATAILAAARAEGVLPVPEMQVGAPA